MSAAELDPAAFDIAKYEIISCHDLPHHKPLPRMFEECSGFRISREPRILIA
jgi:hypothetical protein